jgi:hypothetical protein
MVDIQFVFSSDFNGIRCMKTWEDVFACNPTTTEDIQSTLEEEEEEEYSPEHVTIILRFDSTLSENTIPPWGRGGKDDEENYLFTVRQRKLAENAKTVHSLTELEEAVRFTLRQ